MVSRAFDEWVAGNPDWARPRSWGDFRAGCVAAIERVARQYGSGLSATVVSSGGVIAAICQHLMGVPDDRVAALHWVLYNASITRLRCSRGRITLSSFNSVTHLELTGTTDSLVSYR